MMRSNYIEKIMNLCYCIGNADNSQYKKLIILNKIVLAQKNELDELTVSMYSI